MKQQEQLAELMEEKKKNRLEWQCQSITMFLLQAELLQTLPRFKITNGKDDGQRNQICNRSL